MIWAPSSLTSLKGMELLVKYFLKEISSPLCVHRYLEAIDQLVHAGKGEVVRDFVKNKLLEKDSYRQQVKGSHV